MKLKRLMSGVLISFLFVAAGCSATSKTAGAPEAAVAPAEKMDQAAFEGVYGEAEAARKKAASVGGEWRDTSKFLKQAKSAAEAGDYENAISLAKRARAEAELGYSQAVSQQNVGPPSVLTQ